MAIGELVLGTRNNKKRLELEELLGPLGVRLRILSDFPAAVEVAETGASFAENAALKACEQARHLKCWVLGEDSGLSVDALGGAPGIYSARYSGAEATDQSNNQKLLAALADVPLAQRSARYTCHVALADPDGEVVIRCEDYCQGRIALAPSGTAGFGYDPLFEIVEYHRTFGELGSAVKTVLSHRARALNQFALQLRARQG